ncbi:MAG: hypothetical protein IPK46_20950 [Saprospiraceae bacterium]|nr:hypothetical protein [Saprospiraceae bacterium]
MLVGLGLILGGIVFQYVVPPIKEYFKEQQAQKEHEKQLQQENERLLRIERAKLTHKNSSRL